MPDTTMDKEVSHYSPRLRQETCRLQSEEEDKFGFYASSYE